MMILNLTKHIEMVNTLTKDPAVIMREMNENKLDFMHVALGIAGEAGEIVDAIKKVCIYNSIKNPEQWEEFRENITEELGDLLFYSLRLASNFGLTAEDIIEYNRSKLAKRYPDQVYSNEHAELRLDKAGENA